MNPFTTYNKDEFMPIYREGELDNKTEFIKYKIGKVVDALDAAYFKLGGQSRYVKL